MYDSFLFLFIQSFVSCYTHTSLLVSFFKAPETTIKTYDERRSIGNHSDHRCHGLAHVQYVLLLLMIITSFQCVYHVQPSQWEQY